MQALGRRCELPSPRHITLSTLLGAASSHLSLVLYTLGPSQQSGGKETQGVEVGLGSKTHSWGLYCQDPELPSPCRRAPVGESWQGGHTWGEDSGIYGQTRSFGDWRWDPAQQLGPD